MPHTSTPLKILHLCQRDDPATGGAARVAVEYVKRLPKCGIDAHCLFLYGSPGAFQKELGDRAHYLNISNSTEVWKFGRLAHFIRTFQPQVLHHHDGLLWSHLITYYHPHQIKLAHAHLNAADQINQSLKDRLAAWLQRQSTDQLVCITESTCKSQIEHGGYLPEHTCVIYNGVDTARFCPPTLHQKVAARQQFGIPEDVVAIGFVGRLHCAMKGTDDFLKVISLLPKNFWALVVGDGPDVEMLKHLATTLGISNRVRFLGLVEQIAYAYYAVDVLCFTSHWEPFGLVVAEAMSCQVPVVGFACPGGVNELLHPDTGWVLLKRDLKAMAEAIMAVVYYPENLQRRQLNAQNLLQQNHDWVKNTKTLASLYRQMVQSSAIGQL